MIKKVLCISVLSLLLQGCLETQNGEKIGTIVKLGQEGVLIKTWEAELIRGGFNQGSGSFGKPFYFTIENSEFIPILKKALDEQREVKIHYHKEAVTLFRAESDNYFLDSIEIKK